MPSMPTTRSSSSTRPDATVVSASAGSVVMNCLKNEAALERGKMRHRMDSTMNNSTKIPLRQVIARELLHEIGLHGGVPVRVALLAVAKDEVQVVDRHASVGFLQCQRRAALFETLREFPELAVRLVLDDARDHLQQQQVTAEFGLGGGVLHTRHAHELLGEEAQVAAVDAVLMNRLGDAEGLQ